MDMSKLLALTKNKKAALKPKAKTLKPGNGANRYVLLPGWRKGEEHVYYHDFGQHFIKNGAGELQAVYPCSDKIYGTPCAVCTGLAAAMRSADEDTQKVLKEAVSKQSFLVNVLALDSDDPGTPQILELGKMAFGQLVDTVDEWGAGLFDPETPQVVVINREGKGLNTKYSVQASPKKHTLPAGVLTKLNDLDEYVKQENEMEQRRALLAVNNAAGLLPPPADVPRTRATEEAGAAAQAKRDNEAARPADIALDDELDDLLGDLTGTDN